MLVICLCLFLKHDFYNPMFFHIILGSIPCYWIPSLHKRLHQHQHRTISSHHGLFCFHVVFPLWRHNFKQVRSLFSRPTQLLCNIFVVFRAKLWLKYFLGLNMRLIYCWPTSRSKFAMFWRLKTKTDSTNEYIRSFTCLHFQEITRWSGMLKRSYLIDIFFTKFIQSQNKIVVFILKVMTYFWYLGVFSRAVKTIFILCNVFVESCFVFLLSLSVT